MWHLYTKWTHYQHVCIGLTIDYLEMIFCSGTSSPMEALFKKWLTSPMAGIMATVSRFFVSM
jgi:hypothetical protein